jgi:hypothetical protein
MASSRAGSLLQGIVVGHISVIPLRSKVGASPAREGGLPSTINFRHAIKKPEAFAARFCSIKGSQPATALTNHRHGRCAGSDLSLVTGLDQLFESQIIQIGKDNPA